MQFSLLSEDLLLPEWRFFCSHTQTVFHSTCPRLPPWPPFSPHYYWIPYTHVVS